MKDHKFTKSDERRDQLATLTATTPDEMREQLVAWFNKYEADFRRNRQLLWWFTLLAPVLLTATLLGAIGLIWGFELSGKFVIAAGATFVLLGRFVIPLGSDPDSVEGWLKQINLEPIQLFGMLTYMDVVIAMFIAVHMGFLFRMRWIGPKLAAVVWDGKYLMDKQPWIRRGAFLGLIAFVVFPSSTTGSIGGSIFGRLLGLGRGWTVLGVLLGSLIGNGIMLLFARWINAYIDPDNIWLKAGGIGLIVVVITILEWRYQRFKKRFTKV